MDKKIIVEGQISSIMSFAIHQNQVPVIRNLVITNKTKSILSDIKIKISVTPEFAYIYESVIDILDCERAVEINPVDIKINSDYLFQLTENVEGNIHIELYEKSEKIFEMNREIMLLSYDEYQGVLIMPEIISSFIVDEHPKIAEITQKAKKRLSVWISNKEFSGYNTDKFDEILTQMSAVYSQLQSENIVCDPERLNLENIGIRARKANTVLEEKHANSLEFSLLYAACLEHIGLNPIIVMMKDIVICGCWLEDGCFAEAVQDDISIILEKLMIEQKICLVNIIDSSDKKAIVFDKATVHANNLLQDKNNFLVAIDVRRSRMDGIKPVAAREYADGLCKMPVLNQSHMEEMAVIPESVDLATRIKNWPSIKVTKQKIWEEKLLDLSMKNMLLSFKNTDNAIQLMIGKLDTIGNAFLSGESLKLTAKPNGWNNSNLEDNIHKIVKDKASVENLVQSDLDNSCLHTFLSKSELENNIKRLYNYYKLSLEENGTNTMFVGLGFLKWYESDVSQKARYSPIVLLPVDIIRNIQTGEYRLKIRDEEIQINIVLLEFLRRQFDINIEGLDPLPMNGVGMDIRLVFSTIKKALISRVRWRIDEVAFLSSFSFSRFVMWNDIHNNAIDLERNKVVKSLLRGQLEWVYDNSKLAPEEMDDRLMPMDMAVPFDADYSQLSAIYAASKNQSFVLEGAPGTGKSQTIANIIANSLYEGKTVLFVSQKVAALRDVQNRLKEIGLELFCLELYANDYGKRAVLEQLDRTLNVGRIKSPEQYLKKAETIYNLRRKLNEVIVEIHKKRFYGMSLYEVISRSEADESYLYAGKIQFDSAQIATMKKETLDNYQKIVQKLYMTSKDCNLESGKVPLLAFENTEFTLAIRENVTKAICTYWELLKNLQQYYQEVTEATQIKIESEYEGLSILYGYTHVLLESEHIPAALLANIDIIALDEQIKGLFEGITVKEKLEADILEDFNEAILNIDGNEALKAWKQTEENWFLKKSMTQNKYVKVLREYEKRSKFVTKENIVDIYEKLISYQKQKADIENTNLIIRLAFESMWKGADSKVETLQPVYERALYIQRTVKKITRSREEQIEILKASSDVLLDNSDKKEMLSNFRQTYEQLQNTEKSLYDEFKINIKKYRKEKEWFNFTSNIVEEWLKHIDGLEAWTAFVAVCSEAKEAGIGNVADALKNCDVKPSELIKAFDCNLYRECAMLTINNSAVLSEFEGNVFDDTIRKYRDVIKDFGDMTAKELVSKLASKVPLSDKSFAGSSELGMLKRTIENGGRMMTIKKLFDSIPSLLKCLCPCMIMNPLAVSQYIDHSFKFDLVIFDESSQLSTCEAVGAISRGENVIIVGDTKQLPPSNYFTGNRLYEESYDKEETKSLLDDCLALPMSQQHLRYHYRSRHESLISYSNKTYYNNSLYTFPSPNDFASHVKLVEVNGCYDKGNTNQNLAEAECIVSEIIRRLEDEKLCNDTIGVVTFNDEQQQLIDDLLIAEFRKNPRLELAGNNLKAPIFIKNVEYVQGDTRDVILVSVVYGADKNGNITKNFGFLNRTKSQNRLNVAISRAKKEMIIYSSLKPEQIDLLRTTSLGLRDLRGFLEFGAAGQSKMPLNSKFIKKKEDNIQETIAKRIKSELGYDTKCDIGCSEYKINIGIVNPHDPAKYILGIICDDERYKNAGTAKERNISQPAILKNLGWKIYQVWIIDWIKNPNRELEKIKLKIEKILYKEKLEAGEVKENWNNFRIDSGADRKVSKFVDSGFDKREGINEREEELLSQTTTDSASDEPQNTIFTESKVKVEKTAVRGELEEYKREYEITKIHGTANPNTFYWPQTFPNIMQVIDSIIEKEAPISRKLLESKVLAIWQITRVGVKVENILETLYVKMSLKKSISNDIIFFWRKDQNPEEYLEYRVPISTEDIRTMDNICEEEIANAILDVVRIQFSMSKSDLIKETAKVFGFNELDEVMQKSIENGIQKAKERKYIEISKDGQKISLIE